jgi:hypothetical protein
MTIRGKAFIAGAYEHPDRKIPGKSVAQAPGQPHRPHRQLRGEANAPVQVPGCDIALVHGTGGSIGTRMGSTTLILGQEDA